jgi:hypothetical protein
LNEKRQKMIESILNYFRRLRLDRLDIELAGLLAERTVLKLISIDSWDLLDDNVENSVAIARTEKQILQLKRALI